VWCPESALFFGRSFFDIAQQNGRADLWTQAIGLAAVNISFCAHAAARTPRASGLIDGISGKNIRLRRQALSGSLQESHASAAAT